MFIVVREERDEVVSITNRTLQEIKPPLKQLRVDDEGEIVYVDDGSGSGEEDGEDEEEAGGNTETQDAVC